MKLYPAHFKLHIIRRALAPLFLLFTTHLSQGQTTLIDPAGAGGFELGTGFAANGWTVVNSTFNNWQNSAVGSPYEGTSHAFISNDGGVTNTYSNVTPATSHFYRDMVIPNAEILINLTFWHKMTGENGWDRLLVYAAPTSVTPVANSPASNSTVLSGATLLFTQTSTAGAYTYSGNIAVPPTFAGTTMRLIFTWQNDYGGGVNPPASVDQISLVSLEPVFHETSEYGGLWSDPNSWALGMVPPNNNDVLVTENATLTVDAATYSMRDMVVEGLLNFSGTAATANNLAIKRDLIINPTGTLLAHNASLNQSTGISLTIGRDFHMNGTANLGCTNITFNGNAASGVAQTMDGTGTFYGTNGTGKGLIRAILAANTLGSVTINTTQTLVVYFIFATTGCSTFNTGDKLEISLGANFDGQAVNQSVYEIIVTNHGAGYTSAPVVTIDDPAGGAGVTATAVANMDLVSGTVRSVTVTVGGSQYNTFNPAVTFTGGGFTTPASATAVVPSSIIHGNNLASSTRGTITTIIGTMPVTSHWGVSSITTTSGLVATPVAACGAGYVTAPTVGFSGPTGLNLVTALGSGYTEAPTGISVSGATNISGGAYVLEDFTYVVANGQLVSCFLNNSTKTYDVAPTITLTIPGGAGATVAFPAGCWPAATANLSGGMVGGFNVTNSGFGYQGHPSTGLLGGGFTTAAIPTARCGFYTLNYTSFNPPGYPTPITEGPEMPASRALFSATFNNILGTNINLNGAGGLTFYGAAPLTLTSGQINMNGNNLTFLAPTYAGLTGGMLNRFYNIGTLQMESASVASTVRTAPIGSGIAMNPGTTPTAFITGNNITRWLVNIGTPSGATATGANAYRVRPLNAVGGVGTYGTNPVMTLNWNANDGLISDQESLTVSQGTSFSGPWVICSIPSGAGSLSTYGNRATATVTPGPFVPTGDDYFTFTTTFVPITLVYDVMRTTGIAYTSIVGMAGTTTTIVNSNDDNNYTATLTGTTFTFGGQPVTSIVQNNNGHLVLNGGVEGTTSWLNTIAASRRVIAPFWEDMVAPAAAGIYGGWRVDGTLGSGSAVITFEWKNEETFQNPGPNLNFQVKLYEGSNNIEFLYGVMQGFDGTISVNGAYCYTYSCGLINSTASTLNTQPGQALLQQEENTRNFSAYNGAITNRGSNYLTTIPECYSSILFTQGIAYTQYVAGAGVPVNDEPVAAIPLIPTTEPPADLCGTFYSSHGASATGIAAPICSPLYNNPDDDVWFSFQCLASSSTIKVYSAGGYDAYVEVFDDAGPPLALTGVPGVSVFCQNTASEGATETVNATGLTVGDYYYVRVFHKHGGVQASATAAVMEGLVTAITVTNPGSGYIQAAQAGPAPQQYATPRIYISGGGGNNAIAQVFEGSTGFTGTNSNPQPINSITLMNGGGGYSSPPTVTVEKPNWGIGGNFAITVFCTPVPSPNDSLCNAIAVETSTECSLIQAPLTVLATSSEPAACAGNNDDDVWYSFIADTTQIAVRIDGATGFAPTVELFSSEDNSCSGSLTSLVCATGPAGGAAEVYRYDLVVGNTYFFRVYHSGSGEGSGNYQYCVTTPCAIPGMCGCADNTSCNFDMNVQYNDGSCLGPCDPDCPTDIDLNGMVDVTDFNILISQFGCVEECDQYDLDGDGVVGTSDLIMMIGDMGTVCE